MPLTSQIFVSLSLLKNIVKTQYVGTLAEHPPGFDVYSPDAGRTSMTSDQIEMAPAQPWRLGDNGSVDMRTFKQPTETLSSLGETDNTADVYPESEHLPSLWEAQPPPAQTQHRNAYPQPTDLGPRLHVWSSTQAHEPVYSNDSYEAQPVGPVRPNFADLDVARRDLHLMGDSHSFPPLSTNEYAGLQNSYPVPGNSVPTAGLDFGGAFLGGFFDQHNTPGVYDSQEDHSVGEGGQASVHEFLEDQPRDEDGYAPFYGSQQDHHVAEDGHVSFHGFQEDHSVDEGGQPSVHYSQEDQPVDEDEYAPFYGSQQDRHVNEDGHVSFRSFQQDQPTDEARQEDFFNECINWSPDDDDG
ncbi:hypothetical protein K402DRAFT_185148 [Aulographum hederae CBS 113979]|uniref:Uncharacterized protein n=1 Tax=Aulographum hederae CBS 113979 TaxID=1176131 RepID=A0A6G1GQ67_9PEZI|nr:hypothetical protein K402DRAFT_185148 [Aulographum hederae CBS 113979]